MELIYIKHSDCLWCVDYKEGIATKVSDHQYDLGVKGQDQIYLYLSYGSLQELLFHFLMEGVHK